MNDFLNFTRNLKTVMSRVTQLPDLCLFMESDGLGLWGNKSDIEYKIVHVDGQKYLIATYIQYIKCALYNPQILHVPLWINAV